VKFNNFEAQRTYQLVCTNRGAGGARRLQFNVPTGTGWKLSNSMQKGERQKLQK
jgi:hypothetical protein